MQNIKKTKKPISVVLASALSALCVFSAIPAIHAGAVRADEEDTKEFLATSLGISNAQFSDYSNGSPAGSPNNWTGAALDGNGNIVSGVVDLSSAYSSAGNSEESANKKYKLDQYPEFKSDDSAPRTIFGTPDYAGTDAKTLMINTAENATAAYAYTSSDMTFDRNSFYRVSAWVKTYDFASDTGATIKLTGLGEYCGFPNINTVKNIPTDENNIRILNEANRFGWVKYTMYVRTSAAATSTVKLSLGIGDVIDEHEENVDVVPRRAQGYAFFDTVTADRISAHDFALETSTLEKSETRDNMYVDSTGTILALDLYDVDYFATGVKGEPDYKEFGTFSSNTDMWKIAEIDEDDWQYTGRVSHRFYNSYEVIDIEDNALGLKKSPWAPLGRAEDDAQFTNPMFEGVGGNILMINTAYNSSSETFETGALGIASPDVTIERFKYYRFSVWTKGDSVNGGNGISIGVLGQSNNTTSDNKLDQWYNNLDGDSEDAAHYGWKEQVVYIRGSSINDRTVHFELWLGSPSAQSSGIAMFDNVTFTELSYSEFTEMSGADGGNVISLDATASDTGIANGNFMTIGDYDEFEYPLPAANWSYFPAHNAASNGFSSAEVDTENVKYGIIPVDEEAFDEIQHSVLPGISDPKRFANAPLYNTLVITSPTKTAFAYQSPAVTVAADTGYKLTVEMAVDGVYDGYGASLVLKTSDNNVVSTIENITTTHNKFKTFTFYINAPTSEKTLNLEIWLGLNDRERNLSKLSEGNVYVKSVSYESWTAAENSTLDAEYAEVFERYLETVNNPSALGSLDFGVCSFKAPSLDYYDVYGYNKGELATPYYWTVSKTSGNASVGIFNPKNPNGYRVPEIDEDEVDGNLLLISNPVAAHTTVSLTNAVTLAANTYYRLDVTVRVILSDEDIADKTVTGGEIALTGTVTEKFENIKKTAESTNTFKTYTFFISTGDNGGNVGIDLSLGGDGVNRIAGKMIVSKVELTSINNTAYENAKESLTDEQKAVELSEATSNDDGSDTEDTPSSIDAWIIPTVIFSAALVAAVVIILVLRIRDRLKKKKSKKVEYSNAYDRSKASKDLDKLAAAHNKSDSDSDDDKSTATDDDLDDDMSHEAPIAEDAPVPEDGADEASEPEQKPEQTDKLEKAEKPQDTDLDD